MVSMEAMSTDPVKKVSLSVEKGRLVLSVGDRFFTIVRRCDVIGGRTFSLKVGQNRPIAY
jgi:hypothetical protein